MKTNGIVFCLAACLSFTCNLIADVPGFIEYDSVGGLQFQINAENVVLKWPSDSRESFAVLWRSNVAIETPWVTLTNQFPAAARTNETIFCDVGALNRSQQMRTNFDLSDFYRVYVIPDFWFNLEGVTLNGDSQNGGRDFLPFYYGTKETGIFKPEVELLVDGEDEYFGDEDIQRVNFGSVKDPHWAYAAGFWFRHDLFANGEHTLQIQTLLTLNNVVGQWSQYLTLTNKPVHVRIANDISYVGFPTFVGKTNVTLVAQSIKPRVNWRIDVYDAASNLLITKFGQTTTGEIRWTWDLRDANGRSHTDPDIDHAFWPRLTVWPLDKPLKGGQLLLQRGVSHDWSDKIFGKRKISGKSVPLATYSRPLDFSLPTDKINSPVHRMILDLDEVSHYIKVTPEYSNAVLDAVLPYFSNVAKNLDLPVPQPITKKDMEGFHVLPFREMACSLLLKDGSVFDFHFGFVDRYLSPYSPDHFQITPDRISKQKSSRVVTQNEAIQAARNAIKKLGISLEDVFAEQNPRVTLRKKSDATNAVPYYEIQWLDPRMNSQIFGEVNAKTKKTALVTDPAVDIEINGETKQIEKINLMLLESLRHASPKINVTPISAPDWPPVNPEYARQLIPMMFKAIDEYAKKLSLPIPLPLTTNNVAKVHVTDNEGWPHCEITLTNGWRFVYRHTMVCGYYAPDNFFDSDDRKIHIKDFEGKWNLTTNQAIEIVREALKKLDYPTNHIHMADAKTFIYAASVDRKHIPRLNFQWYYEPNDDLQSRLEAEVNTDNGKLESLYYDDKAFWNSRPPINVPISFPLKSK